MRSIFASTAHRFGRVSDGPLSWDSGRRRLAAAESSPIGVRASGLMPMPTRLLAGAAMALAAVSALAFGDAAYIDAKALVAQALLERAWLASRATGIPAKPWPWADTQTLARLSSRAHGVDVLVLAGASGRTLAFGPAHLDASARPGEHGNIVIAGHRDTHFRFLRDVAPGESIALEDIAGTTTRYTVEEAFVADARALRLSRDTARDELTLITCYPFDAVAPGGTLRYVVVARAAAQAPAAASTRMLAAATP